MLPCAVMNNPKQEFHHWWQMAGLMWGWLWRSIWSRLAQLAIPLYVVKLSSACAKTLTEVLDQVQSGRLKVVLDPASPFPFTEDGVKNAFRLQAGTHEMMQGKRGPHGKIVVQVRGEEGE